MRPLNWSYTTNENAANQKSRLQVSTISGFDDIKEKPKKIILLKEESGYGFSLKTSYDHLAKAMHYICEVDQGSPAEKSGLTAGDYLACINCEDVMHASHDDCLRKIRESGDKLELTVASKTLIELFYKHNISATSEDNYDWLLRNKPDFAYKNHAFAYNIQDETINNAITSEPVERADISQQSNAFSTEAANVRSKNALVPNCSLKQGKLEKSFTLNRNEKGFGFQVAYDSDKNIFHVYHIDCSGPADNAGLCIGDVVTKINGNLASTMNQEKIKEIICFSNDQMELVVERNPGKELTFDR